MMGLLHIAYPMYMYVNWYRAVNDVLYRQSFRKRPISPTSSCLDQQFVTDIVLLTWIFFISYKIFYSIFIILIGTLPEWLMGETRSCLLRHAK
jgi:hypothetical protein